MNLGRAKSILIIAFAGLNLFLGYHLFWPDFGRLTGVSVTAEDLRAIEVLLNDNNYFLQTNLDRSVQVSDFLIVTPARSFQGAILQDFIKKGARVTESEHATAYRAEEETAVVYSSGLIRIIYEPGVVLAEGSQDLEERRLKEIVGTFLTEEQLMPEGIVFDYKEKSEAGYITLYYHQTYKEMPIYAGQLQVFIDSDQLTRIELYWLEPVERLPLREMEVISSAEALKNLVDQLGASPEPRDIKGIELGYFSGEYDAEKWEMPPVWRIMLDSNEHHYINAFTGTIEQETVMPEQMP